MAIPKQVEQQMKELEELEKALQAPAENAEQTADVETDSEPTVAESPGDTADVQESRVPEPPAKVEPQEDWQAKYQTLRGKYDAEIPRLHQQNKELAAALAQLQEKFDALSKAKQPEPEPETRLITEADREAFGPEIVELIERAQKEVLRDAQKMFSVEREALLAEIESLKAQLNSTSAVVSTTTFEQRLARAIPDFDRINVDPTWISWLDEPDPFTGQPRRVYAEFQYSRGNVDEIKRIVDLFKAQTGYGSRQDEARKKELERQVQPSRNPVGAAPSTNQARSYTETEATKLFDRVRQLYAQGRNDEAASLEAELTSAYLQGRVRA